MKLYQSNGSPNSRRVRIYLAEKGISMAVVPVDLGAREQFSEAYAAINPRRVVPALVLDDGSTIGGSTGHHPLSRRNAPQPAAARNYTEGKSCDCHVGTSNGAGRLCRSHGDGSQRPPPVSRGAPSRDRMATTRFGASRARPASHRRLLRRSRDPAGGSAIPGGGSVQRCGYHGSGRNRLRDKSIESVDTGRRCGVRNVGMTL